MARRNLAEAKRWYLQATYDLAAAHWNYQGEFYNTTCFLTQQAAEKGLKSVLYYLGARRQALLTNSVATLIQRLQLEVPRLSETLEQGRLLDLHYIPSRYPDGLPNGVPYLFYSKETASKAIAAATAILTVIKNWFGQSPEAAEVILAVPEM